MSHSVVECREFCFLYEVRGREGVLVSEILDTNMSFVQKTPIPRTNYAVKYATARGHLILHVVFAHELRSQLPCRRRMRS